MKYIRCDSKNYSCMWSNVYCNNNGKETPEDIIKATLPYNYIGPFIASDHVNAGTPKIVSDHNLFIIVNQYGSREIWQIGGKASDITGTIIPHLYRVRQIGIMFD